VVFVPSITGGIILTQEQITLKTNTIWIARHGERIDFADKSWKTNAERPHDPYLSEKGGLQAQRLAQRLAGEGITHIFASPFLRTLQTACPVAESLNLPINAEPGLAEWLNPQWFSIAPTYPQAQAHPQLFARVDQTYTAAVTPTYPETWAEFEARTSKTIDLLIDRYAGNILLVGHGATMTAVAQTLVSGKPRVSTPLCGLTLVTHQQDKWTLALNGDIAHLKDSTNLHEGVWM
jgi:broad specificity phosphatase PhoE